MASVWWWIVPASQASAAARPSDAKLISTPASGTEYSALVNQQTVSYQGQSYTTYQGPFPTKAEAQAAPPGGDPGAVIPVGIGAGVGAATGVGAAAGAAAGADVAGLASIGSALDAFFTSVTDGKMWRSLGWVILGLVLMFIGIGLWIGPAAARRSPLGVLAEGLRGAVG